MAKSSKEIADALGAMMSGDVDDEGSDLVAEPVIAAPPKKSSGSVPASPVKMAQPATAAPPAVKKAPSRPAAEKPVAASPPPASRPSAPSPLPAKPPVARRPVPVPNPNLAPSPAVAKPPAPVRASRPAVPQPAAKVAAPAKPKPATDPKLAAARSDNVAKPQTVEYAKSAPRVKKAVVPFYATLDFRQTIIPPLLVGGGGLVALCVLYFCQPADAPLRSAGVVFPLVVALFGAALLGLAAMNMARARTQLAEAAKVKAETKGKTASRATRSR